MYWDPRSSGGKAPKPILKDVKKPLVVTVHGAGPFSIPGNEYFPNLKERLKGRINKVRDYRNWQNRKGWCSAFIAVSEYCKWEISKYFSLDEKMITPIYHGKNEALFKPSISKDQSEEPFLLHVSSYQPKKNVGRIIEAYGMIESQDKPKLKLIVPGFKQQDVPAGVELVTEKKRPEEIAHLLQQAMGFVFPSTHETFGLPIIEAMACGCPVITSNTTACKEIGGDAAISVSYTHLRAHETR